MPHRGSSEKRPLTKDEVQSRLAASWARTIARSGGKKASFADAIGCHPDTVSNALAGNTVPELHTVLNSLLACPNALDEVLSLYRMRLVPDDAALSPDMVTLIEATRFSAELAEALRDNRRDNRETLNLADIARPLVSKLSAMIAEADDIKNGRSLRSVA